MGSTDISTPTGPFSTTHVIQYSDGGKQYTYIPTKKILNDLNNEFVLSLYLANDGTLSLRTVKPEFFKKERSNMV